MGSERAQALATGWDGVGDPAAWLADNCPCDICRASSPDRSGPRVMTAITARPGESLVGLLCRVTRRNHLRRLRVLLAQGTSVWHSHLNLAMRDDVEFAQMAHAGRLAAHEVEDRRYRQVELTPDLPGVGFHGATIPLYDVDLGRRRIAPSWLSEDPHHCALGHHSIATHCPVSGDLLIDRCPRCEGALLWSRINLEECVRCGHDMRRHEPARVTGRQLRETRLMLDLIHPDPARHGPAAAGLPDGLADLDRGTVFELGWRLGMLLTGITNASRREAGRLPLDTRLGILAAGSRIIASWPDHLHAGLRGVAMDSVTVDASLPRKVRVLARTANLWPAARNAIYDAAPGLRTSASAGVRSVVADAANAGELARSLGVSQGIYERMRGNGVFAPVAAGGSVNQHLLFDASDAAPLRELLADRIALASASERLDIEHHGVEQLCCVGELELITDDRVLAAVKARHITKSSLDDLVARIEANDAALRGEGMVVEDPVAAYCARCGSIGGREKPWAAAVAGDALGRSFPSPSTVRERDRLMGRDQRSRRSCPHARGHDVRRGRASGPSGSISRINRRDTEDLLNVNSKTLQSGHGERTGARSQPTVPMTGPPSSNSRPTSSPAAR